MKSIKKLKGLVTNLPRGGYLLDSPLGYIQFGSPPETIKDTMALPKSVPQIFVLASRLFDWKKGISLSDLEFPIYYNYFFRQQRTHIICRPEQAPRLMRALQEALFGPKELFLSNDISTANGDIFAPDLRSEMDYFRGPIRFRDVLSLGYFKDGSYSVDNVRIGLEHGGGFSVHFDGKKVVDIPGNIEFTPQYTIGERLPEPFEPPLFGVTCLGPSHGFDPNANTSGFIIWLNHSGIMIDPPINSTEWLEASNVNPKLIDSIILTHCHADHDAGTLQKILEEGKITVYATKTVMRSFLKKYSSLTNEPVSYLIRLFDFRPIYIGKPIYMHGGEFNFRYTLHSIPTVAFTLRFQDQSFVYSSDHQGSPKVQRELLEQGVINQERYLQLQNFPWESKVIYHESGIAPLHTPVSFLNSLPNKIRKKIVVYHIAKADFPKNSALTLASFGIENTLYFRTKSPPYEQTYQILGVLKHLDFFDSLSLEKVQEFVSIIEEQYFEQGQKIIEKGSQGSKFYVIRSGNVRVMDDELIGHKIMSSHEYFGEIALLSEVPRTVDVVAETDVHVYAIDKDKFLSFIYGTEFEMTLKRLVKNRTAETWNIIASNPVLLRLTTYQRTWLESILIPKTFKGPGTLIKEKKSLEQFYIIRSGTVEVSKGKRKIKVLKKGDIIGAMHKIHRDELAQFTVSFEKNLSVFAVKHVDVLDFIDGNPGLGMKLADDYQFDP